MLLPTGYSQELVLWEGKSGDTLAPRGVRERRTVAVRGEKTHHALGTRRLGTLRSKRPGRRPNRIAAAAAALRGSGAGRPGRAAAQQRRVGSHRRRHLGAGL